MTSSGDSALRMVGSSRLTGFIRLARLRFLLYNVPLVGLAVAVAVHEGYPLNLKWYAIAQVFVGIAHVMTHYCNEYFDLDADRANVSFTPWSGGSRALVDGLVAPAAALATAFVLLTVGLFLVTTMPTAQSRLLGAAAIALAWFYTAPPLKLNYRGLGEVTAAAVLNGLWPAMAVVLQAGMIPRLLVAVLVPTALLQVARMLIMNLGDRVGDESVGKRTIPVIVGYRLAVLLVIGAQALAYVMLTLFALLGWIPWMVWTFMAATASIWVWLVLQFRQGALADVDPERMSPVFFWTSGHVSLIVWLAMAGVVADAARHGTDRHALIYLSAVLIGYGSLFGHRLWLARRHMSASHRPSRRRRVRN